MENDAQCGFQIVTARDIDEYGPKGIIKKLKDRVGNGNVYITVDIDVLDPVREQPHPQPIDEYGNMSHTLLTDRLSPRPLVRLSPVVGPPVSF